MIHFINRGKPLTANVILNFIVVMINVFVYRIEQFVVIIGNFEMIHGEKRTRDSMSADSFPVFACTKN